MGHTVSQPQTPTAQEFSLSSRDLIEASLSAAIEKAHLRPPRPPCHHVA